MSFLRVHAVAAAVTAGLLAGSIGLAACTSTPDTGGVAGPTTAAATAALDPAATGPAPQDQGATRAAGSRCPCRAHRPTSTRARSPARTPRRS